MCRYASTAPAPPLSLARRSVTPGPGLATGYTSPQVQVVTSSSVPTTVLQGHSTSSYSATRRNSVSVTSMSSASVASWAVTTPPVSSSPGNSFSRSGLCSLTTNIFLSNYLTNKIDREISLHFLSVFRHFTFWLDIEHNGY